MDSMLAFSMGQANRGRDPMVFDWNRAAKRILETGCQEASAGLAGDWEYTGGEIFSEGKPINKEDAYTYLSSTWATPELEIDGLREDCFLMQSETPGWGSGTFWPQSSLDIFYGTISGESEEVKNQPQIEGKID